MICLNNTTLFKNIKLNNHHAYLFYSLDEELNNLVAENFAKMLVCENGNMCNNCYACRQFDTSTHPDVTILKQDSIKVDDVNKIIAKLSTTPLAGDKKVFVILNAETINEISQNKLLKSLEEPAKNNVFILTTTKTDKLLPTVLSRLNKIYLPSLDAADRKLIVDAYLAAGLDIKQFLQPDCTLSEAVKFATDKNFIATVNSIFDLLSNLNTTADIPRVVGELKDFDKSIFFACLQDVFISLANNSTKYPRIDEIKSKYPPRALTKIIPLVERAYLYQNSNVNFTYILDNLLFNILKEKFLCN